MRRAVGPVGAGWPLRITLLAAVYGASWLAVAGVPVELLASEAEWSYGLVGWFALALLMDRSPLAAAVFLSAHASVDVLRLLWYDQDPVRGSVVTVLVLTEQLTVVAAVRVLRRIADRARETAAATARGRTAEEIAERLQADRRARYADLADTTGPLLARIATGHPVDAETRRRCLVEAARMRRLFAEDDEAADPLLHELRGCADLLDRRGVTVYIGTCGDGPTVPADVRRALTDPIMRTMIAARGRARVTVLGSPEEVTVSVVADADPGEVAERPAAGVRVTRFDDDGQVWVEATWRP